MKLILTSKATAFGLALLSAAPAMAQNNYYVVPTSPNAQVSTFGTQQVDLAAAARVQNQQLQNELLRQQIELNRQRLQQQQR
jgi:hypothetical protein